MSGIDAIEAKNNLHRFIGKEFPGFVFHRLSPSKIFPGRAVFLFFIVNVDNRYVHLPDRCAGLKGTKGTSRRRACSYDHGMIAQLSWLCVISCWCWPSSGRADTDRTHHGSRIVKFEISISLVQYLLLIPYSTVVMTVACAGNRMSAFAHIQRCIAGHRKGHFAATMLISTCNVAVGCATPSRRAPSEGKADTAVRYTYSAAWPECRKARTVSNRGTLTNP